jgi:hypothetical protein
MHLARCIHAARCSEIKLAEDRAKAEIEAKLRELRGSDASAEHVRSEHARLAEEEKARQAAVEARLAETEAMAKSLVAESEAARAALALANREADEGARKREAQKQQVSSLACIPRGVVSHCNMVFHAATVPIPSQRWSNVADRRARDDRSQPDRGA